VSIFRYVFCSFFLSFFICYVFLSVCFLFLHVFLSFFLFCLSFISFLSFFLAFFCSFFFLCSLFLFLPSFLPFCLSCFYLHLPIGQSTYLPIHLLTICLSMYFPYPSIHPCFYLSSGCGGNTGVLAWCGIEKQMQKFFLFEDHHPIANMKGCTPIHTLTSRSEGVGI
jgi:hypothetical protein